MSAGGIAELMRGLGQGAVSAASVLAVTSTKLKNEALAGAAAAIRARRTEILEANDQDMAAATAAQLGAPLLDRLRLDGKRVEAIARSIEDIAALADPVGTVAAEWD